ncbi:GID complex subunit containing RING finger motif [Oleoguttula sp. CCFEE 5521]
MADHPTPSKLDPDAHLLLEQSLLRLPHALLQKNLKAAQRAIESSNKALAAAIPAPNSPDPLAALDATIAKAQTLKRKLEALHAEERALHAQQKARIEHLEELHGVVGVGDVGYERWAHVRLDRLLVDYLLRQGFTGSAKALAEEKGLGGLVDLGVFEECGRIEEGLRRGELAGALSWCGENRGALRKGGSELELELRLQQFIELARTGDTAKLMEAVVHARKHFSGDQVAKFGLQAGGLIAYGPDTFVEPYHSLYSPARYPHLASLFTQTHHALFSLPPTPLLHTALSAGLSALKTPACHSAHALATSANTGAPVCPICSTELNELARSVPYAHHTKSHVEEDPVVLPNGRVFGRERLRVLNEKLGTKRGWVRDPTVLDKGAVEWEEGSLRKVFIS